MYKNKNIWRWAWVFKIDTGHNFKLKDTCIYVTTLIYPPAPPLLTHTSILLLPLLTSLDVP